MRGSTGQTCVTNNTRMMEWCMNTRAAVGPVSGSDRVAVVAGVRQSRTIDLQVGSVRIMKKTGAGVRHGIMDRMM